MKRTTIATLLAVALTGALAAPALATGAGAISLTFPIGARYNSMGEAGTALSQDATAIWWNTGGLAFLPQRPERHDIQVMQSSLAAGLASDIALYWLGYAAPIGDHAAVGGSLNYLDMGTQEATDETGTSKGTFSSYEFSLNIAAGVQISSTLGVGLGVKYFRDKLSPDNIIQDPRGGGSGDSFGVDLGLLWKVPAIRSNIGLAISNLGPDITHVDVDQSDPMPRKATVGIAYSVYHSDAMGLLLVGDYLVPLYKWSDAKNDYGFGLETDQDVFGGGFEWNYLRSLFIRFGYKNDQSGDIKNTTWGFGVDLHRWVGQPITFDFAQVPQASGLDRVNRLSLGYRW